MGSWREGVSEEAQNDFDSMFEQGLNVASRLLSKNKEYYPFGLTVSKKGEIRHTMATDGDEHPASNAVIANLQKAFVAAKNELRAIAIVYDVKINTGEDAICLSLEHKQGAAIKIIAPYIFKGFLKKSLQLKTEATSVAFGERIIWA
jgi:hypothetical protein